MAAGASSSTPVAVQEATDANQDGAVRQDNWKSHFAKAHAVLQVSNVSFSIESKNGTRKLVDNVSFNVQSGDLLAMMGPSGAGKTTLLDLITLKASGSKFAKSKASGSVKLNGDTMTENLFRAQAAVCEQYDTHWAFLTCKEIMHFASKLCILDQSVRQQRVQAIMEHLGLHECARTKAGNAFLKGMSGGQRKRLSLGVALLKGPKVLFLDEPTSGLDSASCKMCIEYIEQFAREAQMIIVATIHQPSTDVFMSFTKVLFLANGRKAYLGPPQEVGTYGQSIGHPLPDFTNPADFFIQLINSQFVGREEVDKIVGAWDTHPTKNACDLMMEVNRPDQFDKLPIPRRPGVLSQFLTLLHRHGQIAIRDPTLYLGRMCVFLIANTFFAIIYIKARDREQKYASARYFLVAWFVAVPSMFSVVVVYAANDEFQIARKNLHNGILSTKAFLLAKLALQLPMMALLAICALVVPAFVVGNFNMDGFLMSHVLMTAMIWCFECMGESLGVGIQNPLIGMLGSVGLWFCAFLFSGNFLKPDFIIWPFRLLTYVFPLRWTIRGMNYLELHGTTWEGAELTQDGGFVCPGLLPMQCVGRTGDHVRVSLSETFGNLAFEDTVNMDLCYICIIAAFFKILACALISFKMSWVMPLKPRAAGVELILPAATDV